MNRIIKFRAINANGKMIYGLPYSDGINDTMYFEEYSNRMCWRDESGSHCNQPYKNGTLMQFTGLQDRNGADIYEGDIIKLDEMIVSITFENGSFQMISDRRQGKSNAIQERTSRFEVIGNIFDNSELLTRES